MASFKIFPDTGGQFTIMCQGLPGSEPTFLRVLCSGSEGERDEEQSWVVLHRRQARILLNPRTMQEEAEEEAELSMRWRVQLG